MAIVLSDSRSVQPGPGGTHPIVDNVNRHYKRDKGTPSYGDNVLWTQYDGVNPRDGTTGNFTHIIRNTAAGGEHQAILLSSTSATATPSASNSVLIVEDAAVAIGAGKNFNLFNAAGSNAVTLVHSGTDNVLKTLGGFWALGALNVGSTLTATAAGAGYFSGSVRVATALNVGTTDTATNAGDAYFGRGVRIGSASSGLTAADGQLVVAGTTAPPITANFTGTSAIAGGITIQKSGTTKGSLGLDASDQLAVLNATPAVIALNPAATLFFLNTVPTAYAVASGTTVGASTHVALQMTSATFDTDAMYDSTNKRLKATRAGKYICCGTANYGASANGTLRWTQLLVNATTTIADMTTTEPVGTIGASAVQHTVSSVYVFAVNDFLTLDCFQDTAGNLTVGGNCSMAFVSL